MSAGLPNIEPPQPPAATKTDAPTLAANQAPDSHGAYVALCHTKQDTKGGASKQGPTEPRHGAKQTHPTWRPIDTGNQTRCCDAPSPLRSPSGRSDALRLDTHCRPHTWAK